MIQVRRKLQSTKRIKLYKVLTFISLALLDDYECGKRNKLEFITMLAPDGSLNENGAPYTGMMRYDARIKVEEDLKEKGLYRGKEPNKMRLGICSRSGDILEPMISAQWYVNCDGMAKRATDAVRNGDLKIIPAEQERTWFQWLDNIRDWCVSRQLWWGHQIPAWFATKNGEEIDKNDMSHNNRWIVARCEEVRRIIIFCLFFLLSCIGPDVFIAIHY
jgi:valyl-tRNA synthetase